jgi:hypothetical protein
MPGAIQELKIGPFSGGINSHADKSAIADAEMVDCINFDIDLDGSLVARPPFTLMYSTQLTSGAVDTSSFSYAFILGTYTYNNARAVVFQLVNSESTTAASVYTYYLDGPSAGTAVAQAGLPFVRWSKILRYENTIYYIPRADAGGGGASVDLTTNIATAIAGMPGGNQAIIYKFSMFIGGGKSTNRSRVFYSALANFTSWPGANFFDIAPGDGDSVQDFLIYQDNILIAKETGTYVLAYDASPLQAVVRLVSNYIGVKGPNCLVAYENSVFFATYTEVYEMVNYDFTRVSTKIPFQMDKTIDTTYGFNVAIWQNPVWMSNVTDRLICRFYNTIYVYHLRLRSWTRWDSNDPNISYMGPIFETERNTAVTNSQNFRTYVSSTSLNYTMDSQGFGAVGFYSRYAKLFKFEDRYEGTYTENGNIFPVAVDIQSTLITKVFDIGVSHRFKRLMHWGADVITSRSITGTLYPFSVSYFNTWAQLSTYKWSQLNTWAYPLTAAPQTVVTNNITSGVIRRFIRFPKSLRFRLLQFQIDMVYSGNTTDGPDRLYTLTAFIAAKQLVPHSVN